MFLISSVSFVSFKKASPDMIRLETTFVSYGELLVGPERSQSTILGSGEQMTGKLSAEISTYSLLLFRRGRVTT